MAGGIAVLLKQFGDRCTTIKAEVTHSALETVRMPTGHEADSTWLTSHSGSVEPVELRAALGEVVDIGCFRVGMAVATKVAIAKVVSEDENDVRPTR